ARHAGLVGKPVLEWFARVPVEVDLAAEYRYRDPLVDEHTLALVISQSGETADTLAAMREARARGARVLSITNVVGSSLARESDHVIYTVAGPEVAVASTKAYTTQLVALYLLAGWLGLQRGTVSAGEVVALASTAADRRRLVALSRVAGWLGRRRGTVSAGEVAALIDGLSVLPAQLEAVLAMEDAVAALARRFLSTEHVFFLGRGL